MILQPFVGGEEGVGLVVGEEVADHLRAFCHEETFTTAELLLFQLTDEFDLILTDCHRLYLRILQIIRIILCKGTKKCRDYSDYTEFFVILQIN